MTRVGRFLGLCLGVALGALLYVPVYLVLFVTGLVALTWQQIVRTAR